MGSSLDRSGMLHQEGYFYAISDRYVHFELDFQIITNMSRKEVYRYKLTAEIIKLTLRKSIAFDTKVLWKRNVSKAETKVATHTNYESIFNQTLHMELSLVYSKRLNKFETKNTELSVLVLYQDKVKSGGYVKIDIAEIVNSPPSKQKRLLKLVDCPDSSATIEVIFSYVLNDTHSRNLFNELNNLNVESGKQDVFEYGDSDSSVGSDIEIDVDKEFLEKSFHKAKKLKQNPNATNLTANTTNAIIATNAMGATSATNATNAMNANESSSMGKLMNSFQGLGARLKNRLSLIRTDNPQGLLKENTKVDTLMESLKKKDEQIEIYQKELGSRNQEIKTLQEQLRLKTEAYERLSDWAVINTAIVQSLSEKEEHYRNLYQKLMNEINTNASSQDLKRMTSGAIDEMQTMSKMPNIPTASTMNNPPLSRRASVKRVSLSQLNNVDMVTDNLNERLEIMEMQSRELRTRLSTCSFQLAQMFNAAQEKGGCKLVEYFHRYIGMKEY